MRNIILITIVVLLANCHITLANDNEWSDCDRYRGETISGVVSDIKFITRVGQVSRTIIYFEDKRVAIFSGISVYTFQIGKNNIICRHENGYVYSVEIE